jgi:F-type H+-transporting ATPase subunit gamma
MEVFMKNKIFIGLLIGILLMTTLVSCNVTTKSLVKSGDSVIPIGKRAVDYCNRRYNNVITSEFLSSEKITDAEIASLSSSVADGYKNGDFGAVYIISTKLISVLNQEASYEKILPLRIEQNTKPTSGIFEPDPVTVMNYAIKSYMTALICNAVRQSYICELYSRRNAMDSASENAENLINDLNLAFNRARQSSITQEITEIVAGAEEQ